MARGVALREATGEDLPFLREMLYEAVYWKPGRPRPSLAEAFENRELAKILADWGRAGDRAIVAEIERRDGPVAAAWYRYWSDEDHSYGYVDADTPELGCAVVRRHRGRGLGYLVLHELMRRAAEAGVTRMSLSVERANEPAIKLYRRLGFHVYAERADTYTMLCEL